MHNRQRQESDIIMHFITHKEAIQIILSQIRSAELTCWLKILALKMPVIESNIQKKRHISITFHALIFQKICQIGRERSIMRVYEIALFRYMGNFEHFINILAWLVPTRFLEVGQNKYLIL